MHDTPSEFGHISAVSLDFVVKYQFGRPIIWMKAYPRKLLGHVSSSSDTSSLLDFHEQFIVHFTHHMHSLSLPLFQYF